jgi:hypothetical protein
MNFVFCLFLINHIGTLITLAHLFVLSARNTTITFYIGCAPRGLAVAHAIRGWRALRTLTHGYRHCFPPGNGVVCLSSKIYVPLSVFIALLVFN